METVEEIRATMQEFAETSPGTSAYRKRRKLIELYSIRWIAFLLDELADKNAEIQGMKYSQRG